MSSSSKPKVVLAYSGGLDTSVILKWLCEKGFDVIAFCADVGQHHEDFEAVKAKAVSCGAIKCVVTDLRSDFVSNYIFEALKCNAIYEGRYLLGTSVARPCIAKEMVRIAHEEGAMYVAHGATGKGNDQVRFEMCAQALDAKIRTIAPWRDAEFIESFKGRSDLLAYCTKHGIPVDAKPKSNYSIDENLFHTSYESGVLEDAGATYDEDMFKMTVSSLCDLVEPFHICASCVPLSHSHLSFAACNFRSAPRQLLMLAHLLTLSLSREFLSRLPTRLMELSR